MLQYYAHSRKYGVNSCMYALYTVGITEVPCDIGTDEISMYM